MSSLQPVIKWSGSKRSQAEEIISYFPRNYNTYYEPFIGGGSILDHSFAFSTTTFLTLSVNTSFLYFVVNTMWEYNS